MIRPILRPLTSPLTRAMTDGVLGGAASIVSDGVLSPLATFTRGSTATYFDSAGVMQTAAANTPRIDYDPVTHALRGLLLEEQRTNLLARSAELESATWGEAALTVSANNIASPDGSANAEKLIINAGTNSGFAGQTISKSAAAVQYAWSVFAKQGEWNCIGVYLIGGGTSANRASIVVNLATGSTSLAANVKGTFTGASANITPVGGGWYRIALTATTGTETTVEARIYPSLDGTFPDGDGTSGIFVWGAQLEAGAFATSYTPTTSTSVTRAADAASFTVPAGIIRLVTTYDDATTATTTVTPGATYNIPTGQKRIRRMMGYRT